MNFYCHVQLQIISTIVQFQIAKSGSTCHFDALLKMNNVKLKLTRHLANKCLDFHLLPNFLRALFINFPPLWTWIEWCKIWYLMQIEWNFRSKVLTRKWYLKISSHGFSAIFYVLKWSFLRSTDSMKNLRIPYDANFSPRRKMILHH